MKLEYAAVGNAVCVYVVEAPKEEVKHIPFFYKFAFSATQDGLKLDTEGLNVGMEDGAHTMQIFESPKEARGVVHQIGLIVDRLENSLWEFDNMQFVLVEYDEDDPKCEELDYIVFDGKKYYEDEWEEQPWFGGYHYEITGSSNEKHDLIITPSKLPGIRLARSSDTWIDRGPRAVLVKQE